MLRHTLVHMQRDGHRAPVLPLWQKLVQKSMWPLWCIVMIPCFMGLGGYVLLIGVLIYVGVSAYDFIAPKLRT